MALSRKWQIKVNASSRVHLKEAFVILFPLQASNVVRIKVAFDGTQLERAVAAIND